LELYSNKHGIQDEMEKTNTIQFNSIQFNSIQFNSEPCVQL